MTAEGAAGRASGSGQPIRVSADEEPDLRAEKIGADTQMLTSLYAPSKLENLPASYLKALWQAAKLLGPEICVNNEHTYLHSLIPALFVAQFSLLSLLGRLGSAEFDGLELDDICFDSRFEVVLKQYQDFYQAYCPEFRCQRPLKEIYSVFSRIRGICDLFPTAIYSESVSEKQIRDTCSRQPKYQISDTDIQFFLQVRHIISVLDAQFYLQEDLSRLRREKFSVSELLIQSWERYFLDLGFSQPERGATPEEEDKNTMSQVVWMLRCSRNISSQAVFKNPIFLLDITDFTSEKCIERYAQVFFEEAFPQKMIKEILERYEYEMKLEQYWRAYSLLSAQSDVPSIPAAIEAAAALLIYFSDPQHTKVIQSSDSIRSILESYQHCRFQGGQGFTEDACVRIVFLVQKFLPWQIIVRDEACMAGLLEQPVEADSRHKIKDVNLAKGALERFAQILRTRDAQETPLEASLENDFEVFLKDHATELYPAILGNYQLFWGLCAEFVTSRIDRELLRAGDEQALEEAAAAIAREIYPEILNFPLISVIFPKEVVRQLRTELATHISVKPTPSVLQVSAFSVATALPAGPTEGSSPSAEMQ